MSLVSATRVGGVLETRERDGVATTIDTTIPTILDNATKRMLRLEMGLEIYRLVVLTILT